MFTLLKMINSDRDFKAINFVNNGNMGTLVSTTGRTGGTHYRIDQQDQNQARDFANIQYQVGADTKASCQIRYNPRPASPCNLLPNGTPCNRQGSTTVPDLYARSRLEDHFKDGSVKGRVTNGLDWSSRTQHGTELRWIALPITRKRKNNR